MSFLIFYSLPWASTLDRHVTLFSLCCLVLKPLNRLVISGWPKPLKCCQQSFGNTSPLLCVREAKREDPLSFVPSPLPSKPLLQLSSSQEEL